MFETYEESIAILLEADDNDILSLRDYNDNSDFGLIIQALRLKWYSDDSDYDFLISSAKLRNVQTILYFIRDNKKEIATGSVNAIRNLVNMEELKVILPHLDKTKRWEGFGSSNTGFTISEAIDFLREHQNDISYNELLSCSFLQDKLAEEVLNEYN